MCGGDPISHVPTRSKQKSDVLSEKCRQDAVRLQILEFLVYCPVKKKASPRTKLLKLWACNQTEVDSAFTYIADLPVATSKTLKLFNKMKN